MPGGHDGKFGNRKYFDCPYGNGIFAREITQIIPSESILQKLAELYDILKGKIKQIQTNKHNFISGIRN